MADLPIVMTKQGLLPIPPTELLRLLIEGVTLVRPGYTANLPGSLIEDVSSTDVGALISMDSARIEVVNSLTPYGANAFLLNQLGAIYGVAHGTASNTSVYVTFFGVPGFVIGRGFIVSDGSFHYVVRDGGIIKEDGESPPLFAVADQPGSFAVPAGTVTQLVTSVPSDFPVTCNNLSHGVPGVEGESEQLYRSRVLQAGLAASTGMLRYLRTLLGKVEGVQARLVGVRQQEGGGWSVISGGGDPYDTANAIATALFDVSTLVGSTLNVVSITAALPGVLTTDLDHGYQHGQDFELAGSDPPVWDGAYTALHPDGKTLQLGKRFPAQDFATLVWAAGIVTATVPVDHGITEGSTFTVVGADPAVLNGNHVATAGTTSTTLKWALAADPGAIVAMGGFIAGIARFDATGFAAYEEGGVLEPNLRNREVALQDYPDTYVIPFIDPPQQTVAMVVTWNTSSPNFVSEAAIIQLVQPAMAQYVNSVYVTQPLNLFEMIRVFQDAVASVLPAWLITRLVFEVSINGVVVPPDAGTGIIEGDPESYFFTVPTAISVVQS